MKKTLYFTMLLLLPFTCISYVQGSNASMFFVVPRNRVDAMLTEQQSRLSLYSEDPAFSLPATSFQKVLTQEPDTKGNKITVQTGTNETLPLNNATRKMLLADSRMLSLDSPLIQKIARTIHDAKQPLQATEEFVYNYITDKTIGIPLVSAETILKIKAGDCTEHTVLAVALLRAAGIPARALVGVILVPRFEAHKNVFVFHMWAEAFWNGKWHLVDATSPQRKYRNRYIAFAVHSLKTPMTLQLTQTLGTIKKLEINYIQP